MITDYIIVTFFDPGVINQDQLNTIKVQNAVGMVIYSLDATPPIKSIYQILSEVLPLLLPSMAALILV